MKKKMKLRQFLVLPVIFSTFFVNLFLSKNETPVNAIFENEDITIYLDTSTTVASLGWWDTPETYINYSPHIDTWVNTKMTRVGEKKLFSYTIPAEHWNLVNSSSEGKIEFYVYDWSSATNIVYDTTLFHLKTNELNLFKLTSTENDGNKRAYELKNKEVEEVISDILGLNCDSTKTDVEAVIAKYNSLRPMGKENLNTWLVGEPGEEVTWFERLTYFSVITSALPPSNDIHEYSDTSNSVAATVVIGVIGITTIAGYYFITKKSEQRI